MGTLSWDSTANIVTSDYNSLIWVLNSGNDCLWGPPSHLFSG